MQGHEFLWNLARSLHLSSDVHVEEETMDGIIYLVGLIVIIMFILSIFGLR
jgi:predicted membrane channel-forming protein YqfA (hemolysin III family)